MTGELILLGRSGQVATAIAATADGRTIRQLGRPELDLALTGNIARLLDPVLAAAPPGSVLVNAAAHTDVGRAEGEPELAHRVNTLAPRIIAECCREAGLPLIQLSTDYVYDGRHREPYRESDACNPISVYGRTKLAGDEAVEASGARHIILRTSAVFSATGQNFLRTMLKLGGERDRISVVDDQTTCPTAAADIAAAIWAIAGQLAETGSATGVFNFCGDTPRSWADFAQDIFAAIPSGPLRETIVQRVSTADYPTPARRPAWSVLDCRAIQREFGIDQPDYARALANTLAELGRAL